MKNAIVTTAKDLVKTTKETEGKMSAATPLVEATTQRGSSHCSQNTWLSVWKQRRPFPSRAPNVKLGNGKGHSCISENRHADSMKQPPKQRTAGTESLYNGQKTPKHSFEYLSKLDNKNANISGWTSQSQIQTKSVDKFGNGTAQGRKSREKNLFI